MFVISHQKQIVDLLMTIFVGTSTRILMTSEEEEMFKDFKSTGGVNIKNNYVVP